MSFVSYFRKVGLRAHIVRSLAVFVFACVLSPAAWAGVDWVVNNSDTGFDPVPAGGDIVYTVRVDNNGDTNATSTTLILSIPPTTSLVSTSGMSCSGTGPVNCIVPSLSVGDNATVLVTIRTTAQGTVTLGATIPAADDDAANNTANQTTTVVAGANIALSLSGPASAQSGSTVSYTFTATNNGPDASGNQTLSFPVPTGLVNIAPPAGCTLSGSTYNCTVAGLAVGASVNLTFTGQIAAASGSTVTPAGSIAAASGPADPVTSNNTATINTTVTAGSDVLIGKSRAPSGTLLVGQAVTFTLTPSYTGDAPGTVTVTDTLPANYTVGAVASPQNGWTCTVSGQTVSCTKTVSSPAGNNLGLGTITIPATVVSPGANVTNTASISGSITDPNPGNNSGTDTPATIQAPTVDLRANKSGPNPPLVVVGNNYDFTISVTNVGNTAFFGTLVMTDNLPAGLTVTGYTLDGWSCAPAAPVVGPTTITCQRVYTASSPLAAGATTPAVTLNTTATATGSIANSMTVSSPDANIADTNPGNDTATYTVTGSNGPNTADIQVSKTASGPVAAGDVLTYTITVTNAGPTTATNIALTDSLTSLINDAVGPTGAGFVSVSSTGPTVCTTSSGGATTRNLSCPIASLASGASETFTVQVRPGGNGGNRSNTAQAISSDTADPNLANNSATVTSTVDSRADVTVTKTATLAAVAAGQDLTYVVTATNLANGLSQAQNVSITDTLPNSLTFVSASPSSGFCSTTPTANSTTGPGNNQVSCNLGTLNNGAQQTVTIVVRPNNATRGSSITNGVSVATTTTEIDTTNNSASVVTSVQNPALDLSINKTESVDPLAVGDNTVYTVTVTNQGPSAAENVVITDTLPPTRLSYQSHTPPAGGSCSTVPAVNSTGGTLVCQVPYLPAGQSRSLTVTMQGIAKGVATNTASVSSDESLLGFDTNAVNNSVTENTTVRTKADVAVVSKTPSASPVNLRELFNFVIKVRNNVGPGLAEADNVVVNDTLPAGMELTGTPSVSVVAGTASSTSCTGSAGSTAFSCNLGTLSSGGEVDITVLVRAVTVSSNPQTFTNTASVTTTSLDVNTANNSASGGVDVNSSSLAGRAFRDFNNNGSVDAGDTGIAGVSMTLTGTSFDGAAINRTVTTDASGNYTFAILPAGTYTITEGAVSEAHLTDGIDTAGSAGGNTAVNDVISGINLPANTAATGYTFAEVPQARIGIAKQVITGPTTTADGSFIVSFRMAVKNFSIETLNSVAVTDVLAGAAPGFGSFVAGGPAAVLGNGDYTIQIVPSGTCVGLNAGFDGSGNPTVATVPSLAPDASCTIDFTVRARSTAPQPPVSGVCGARYCNQASVTGNGALSGQTPGDLSDNGANPDPNGNGQAGDADENDPTPVAPAFNAAIGIAKQLNGNVSAQPDGSLLVPVRLVVTNFGNESLSSVSVTDPLAAAAGGQFGGYVAGGAAAALASGQYTVQAAPAFVGACSGGTALAGFTGDTGSLALASIAALAPGASCTLDFSFRFQPTPATAYTNQARASGTSDFTGTGVNDLSDDGANPDPNGNGRADDAGENDPTPVPVPRIGIAKSAGGVVNNGDGTYRVPFTLTVRNAGQTPLNNVQVTDIIAGALPQFGTYTGGALSPGQYTIEAGPNVSAQTNGAVLVAAAPGSFTGSGASANLLDPAGSSLPNFGVNASQAQISFTIRFYPVNASALVFENRAVASGSPPGGGTVNDDSVDGANPDANGNGDPNDDTSPTVMNLAAQAIGVAKSVSGIVQTGAKKYRIPYILVVQNVSTTTTATNVQVTDNLLATFPTAQSISMVAAPSVTACTGSALTPNPGFNGIGNDPLLAGNQNLAPGERCTIQFTVEVDFGSNPLPNVPQNNQATATTHQTPGGTVIASDLSDDGNLPDPNGNGNAGDPGEDDPTPVSFAAAGLSAVSGTVYLDANHNRSNDDPLVSSRIAGFIVEVLNAAGTVVASGLTDASGNYTVGGLFPSTAGDPATYYSVRFREPTSGAIYGVPQSDDPTPARNGTIQNGVITGLELAPGVTTLQQNLPLDPSGVVYDAVTRNPIAGATVTLLSGGVPVPDACLVGGINTQITGPSGQYQFLLIDPAPPGCPGSGTYTLQVVQPGGYLPPWSTLIPPQTGTFITTLGGVDAIQAQASPPVGANPTIYYTSFALVLTGNPATSSSQLVNNHIPIDPVLEGAIHLTKTTPLVNVSVGQLVPYTITARNTLAANLTNIDLRDTVPPGFKYKPGSATVDGVALEPTVNGRVLTWPNLAFAPNATRIVKLLLVVGAGVQPGEYVNTAQGFNNLVPPPNPNAVSNVATATVRVVPDPLFDCSDLIGKVFDDKNANGYQDEGEPGIPNVRLATARGWLVTTDAEGRFHVACAAIPDADRGSNFVMKLDERTLPTGYRLTTENPRDVRLTRGKMSKLNFGATIHRVLRVDMGDASFVSGQTALKPEWAKQIAGLPDKLKARPSVVRLGYKAGAEGEVLARERLKAVSEQLKSAWKQPGCCHTLLIEEELLLPARPAEREGK